MMSGTWQGTSVSSEVYDRLLVGVTSRRERDISSLMPLVYDAQSRGWIDETQAGMLQEAAQLRRNIFAARRRVESNPKPPAPKLLPSDRRSRALRHRRVWAGSGALPHNLRTSFTHGENAVAAVIRAEVRKYGQCALAWGSIAKAAGLLSTTVVKRFVRIARKLRLIHVEERRVKGARNLPSIITIISAEWLAWIEYETRSVDRPADRGHDRTSLQITGVKNFSLRREPASASGSGDVAGAYERGSLPARYAIGGRRRC